MSLGGAGGLLIVDSASWRGENPICQAICPATQNLNRKAHFGTRGLEDARREREREKYMCVVVVCPRVMGDTKSGSGITGEGESEIRPSNRISRGQTLSVTKPTSILGYRWPFNVSERGAKEPPLPLTCKIPRHRAPLSFGIRWRLIGLAWIKGGNYLSRLVV